MSIEIRTTKHMGVTGANKREGNVLDIYLVSGATILTASLFILMLQLMNPFGLAWGILYSFIGVKVLHRSKRGLYILNNVSKNAIIMMKNYVCNSLEEGSCCRIIMEMTFAYGLYVHYQSHPSLPKALAPSGPVMNIKQKSQSVFKTALLTISKKLPDILDRNKGDTRGLFQELSKVGKEVIAFECRTRSKHWLDMQIYRTISAICQLWSQTWKNFEDQYQFCMPFKKSLATLSSINQKSSSRPKVLLNIQSIEQTLISAKTCKSKDELLGLVSIQAVYLGFVTC